MRIECSYCGQKWHEINGACSHCGAPNKLSMRETYNPVFYDGYIVYETREPWSRVTSFIFYKGIQFMGRVDIDDEYRSTWNPSLDPMPEIMKMLNRENDNQKDS